MVTLLSKHKLDPHRVMPLTKNISKMLIMLIMLNIIYLYVLEKPRHFIHHRQWLRWNNLSGLHILPQ